LAILDGRKPIDVAKTQEGKKKLIELLQSIETEAKKTKRPGSHLVDYTIIKRELGLLRNKGAKQKNQEAKTLNERRSITDLKEAIPGTIKK